MLEKIIELLLGFTVAAAGAAGIGVAQQTAPNAGDLTGIAEKVAAWQRAAEARLSAEHETETATEADVQSADGLATALAALAALAEAMELAPDAADFGLGTAWEAVTNAPSGEEEGAAAASEEIPGGPPAGVPPVDVPAGPPSETGRP